MSDDYKPNSIDAVLSRIETKLDGALQTQAEHATAIRRLWAALSRLDVRVAGIAAGISVAAAIVKMVFFK
jgi:hypothetical protein